MSKDYHRLFDLVKSKFLHLPVEVDGQSSYFHNDFDCRALLFSICVIEHDAHSMDYTSDEKNMLQQFMQALPTDKQISEKPIVISCLEFFETKL